ncbi:serine-threonine rich protein [Sclerotinia borealis F-4128]|uniref:Serine-threonine rich protein n=1 Tax=Sclerotinia borealis (strain F-4128) TaxID=1432307 RepID=W9C4Q7_SCLBF|nr:serine-threonine rich protein [Sclerotinia borealis F-4128]
MKFSSISTISGLFALTSAQLTTDTVSVASSFTLPTTITQINTITEGGSDSYQTSSGPAFSATTTADSSITSDYMTAASGTTTSDSYSYDGGSESTEATTATSDDYNGESYSTDATTTTPPSSTSTSSPYSYSPSRTVHNITVGAQGLKLFSPNQLNASLGDIVRFNFLARNATVTQSNLDTPCIPNGGADTGFNQFNPENQTDVFVREFLVNTTEPIWLYCAQTLPKSHCQNGMVLGINPAGKFDAYLEKAIESGGTRLMSVQDGGKGKGMGDGEASTFLSSGMAEAEVSTMTSSEAGYTATATSMAAYGYTDVVKGRKFRA